MSGEIPDISAFLPDSLNLPPHLSAHKYFFVCTLTVAAWDTLVLSPRTFRLFKTPEWPPLKIIFHILRILMPVEFVVVAVAFFDTGFSLDRCSHFYLFEPIATAVLVNLCAIVHAVRIYAIFDKSKMLLAVLGAYIIGQIAVMAVACAFYRVMPLKEGQGCIAGPRADWVGVYWLVPTVFFLATFVLALARSLQSRAQKPLGAWKLMLRDGLNLYGAIAVVNIVNAVFWFAASPSDTADTIKTIVTSMAAVLTTTMTLRIILSVRGSLADGGAYAGTSSAGTASRGTTHVISTRGAQSAGVHVGSVPRPPPHQAYTLEEMRAKAERDWDADGRSSLADGKDGSGLAIADDQTPGAVKVTIDREVAYGYGKN